MASTSTETSLPGSRVARLYDGVLASDALIAKAVRVSEVSQIAKLERRLFEYVAAEWLVRRKKAAAKAGEMAERGRSSAKIAAAVGRIMRPWARAIQPRFNREIKEIYRLARIASHKKATKQLTGSLQFNTPHVSTAVKKALQSGELLPSFDLIDDATVEAMKGQNTLWIGEHYDKNVVGAINETTRKAVETGTVGRLAGKEMSKAVNDTLSHIKVPKGFTGSERQYFEGLVANAATNARAQGQIRSFASLGVTHYEIVNPGDERTCPVCQTFDGKVFSIKHGVDQVVNDLQANTPDEVRTAHPWPLPSLINGSEKKGIEPLTKPGPQGPEDAKKLAEKGFALPPYHFRCRCTVDVAPESLDFESLGDPISVDALVKDIGRAAGVAQNAIPVVTSAPAVALPASSVTPTKPYNHEAMRDALTAKPEGRRFLGTRTLQFSEEQQAAIRKELNALLQDHGLINRDVLLKKSAKAEYFFRPSARIGKAAGVHSWTGRIQMSTGTQAGAKRFLKRSTSARAATRNAPLTAKTAEDARNYKTLVHEGIHGCSPMTASAYKGIGKTVEEATTEVASRAIMRTRFGVNLNPRTSKVPIWGSYQDEIDLLTNAIKKSGSLVVELESLGVTALTEAEALASLERASFAMRAKSMETIANPNHYARHFVDNVNLPPRVTAGLKPKQVKELHETFRSTLRGALDIQ